MKKYIAAALILIVLIAAGGAFAFFYFFNGGSWQGTWWGVQDAGVNWTGDNMQNLETVTFTRNDDGTITVDHKAVKSKAVFPAKGKSMADACRSLSRMARPRAFPTTQSTRPLRLPSPMQMIHPSH